LIFDLYINEGMGVQQIVKNLESRGIPSPTGSPVWKNASVLRMLKNEKYMGTLKQKKQITVDYKTHERKINNGEENFIIIENNHEAIIDLDVWDKVQLELAKRSNKKKLKNRHSNRYWCSGKMVCGECGKSFRRSSKTNPNVRDYRCYANSAYGRKRIVEATGLEIGCNNVALNDVALAHCMKETINFIKLNKPQLLDECLQEIKLTQATIDKIDTSSLQNKIAELNSLKSKAIDLLLRNLITEEDLSKQNSYYESEIEKINTQIAEAKKSNNSLEHQQSDIKKYADELNKILQCEGDDTSVYKEILDKFVIYSGKTLIIYLQHMPFGLKFKYKMTGKKLTYRALTLEMQVVPHYSEKPIQPLEIGNSNDYSIAI